MKTRLPDSEVARRNARIVEMAKNGMHPDEIAEVFGVSSKTVKKHLYALGVKYINKRQIDTDKRYRRKMWEEGDPLPEADDEKNVAELKEVAKGLQSGRTNDNNLW
jgi:transposase